jgi:hypothetical protein
MLDRELNNVCEMKSREEINLPQQLNISFAQEERAKEATCLHHLLVNVESWREKDLDSAYIWYCRL